MKKKIVSILVCMLMFVTVSTVTGTSEIDANPNRISKEQQSYSTLAAWDLLATHDIGATGETGANGNSGAEFDGTYHYSTRWASNLIHQYDINGNLQKEFSISGVSGLRDLAWDGEYMYGGAAGGQIWQMDFINEENIATISGGFACRAIAYNSDLDVFYVSNWDDPVWIVDRDGTIVDQFSLGTATSTYGFAYDPDPNGPYLWVFDQTAGAESTIYQWNLTAGEMTGFSYDVNADVGSGVGIAGGLWLAEDYQEGLMCIGGCVQDSSAPGVTDWLFVYELYQTNLPPELPSIPTGPEDGIVDIVYDFSTSTIDPDEDMVSYGWDYNGDSIVDEWTKFYDSGDTCTVSHSFDSPGAYKIKVRAKDEEGLESSWSGTHTITIIEIPDLEVISVSPGFLRVKAEIANTGPVVAENVNWAINLEGGIILAGKSTSGTEEIKAGEFLTIQSGIIFGIGNTKIKVTVENEYDSASLTRRAFLLGIFFI